MRTLLSLLVAFVVAVKGWFVAQVRLGYRLAEAYAEPDRRSLRRANRAQVGGNLVSVVIGVAVAVIVGVGVAIPIVNDVIASANLSGITQTIVGFIPVMMGVLIFVATVGPIMRRS